MALIDAGVSEVAGYATAALVGMGVAVRWLAGTSKAFTAARREKNRADGEETLIESMERRLKAMEDEVNAMRTALRSAEHEIGTLRAALHAAEVRAIKAEARAAALEEQVSELLGARMDHKGGAKGAGS